MPGCKPSCLSTSRGMAIDATPPAMLSVEIENASPRRVGLCQTYSTPSHASRSNGASAGLGAAGSRTPMRGIVASSISPPMIANVGGPPITVTSAAAIGGPRIVATM